PVPVPLPWRSVWLPRVAVLIALISGLPLYLRSPLWCDITLYDLATRNLLDGGIHYRDLFDTNLPGFVWLLTALRWLFGPSAIVVRIADLMVITGVVILIDRLAKWGGATRATRWWALAGVAFLYPFAVEMVHAQRDTWMALPALVAIALRVRRMTGGAEGALSGEAHTRIGSAFRQSVLEGAIWGLAVWLKPHIVLMAAGTWLFTIRRLTYGQSRPWSFFVADLLGNLTGGIAIGICGLAWLIGSGTWPHFWSVVTVWNPEYTKLASREFSLRVEQELHWFPPWSLWLIPTVPLALLSIIDAAPWSGYRGGDPTRPGPVGRLLPSWLWDREAGRDARFVRGLLGGLYLVWAIQAFCIQRGFMYVHMPETLLMFGVWAAHRWAMPVIPLLWMLLTSCLWLYADANSRFREELLTIAVDKHVSADVGEERYIVRHPLAEPNRIQCWPECWRCDLTTAERYALWDRLRRIREHEASISWEELSEVVQFLRKKGVKDGEVLAWHDSPHAVYLMLGIKPGLRFMHVCTAQLIGDMGYCQVMTELTATQGTARFAIGDLEWATLGATPAQRLVILGPPASPTDLLPAGLNSGNRATFPFNQRTVFRTRGGLGRYTVHELVPPFGDDPSIRR
ncbi:MAG TPA: hypothetical protein VG097_11395, partial [Gemmata sp.]|nr:hypothetical protein [Gemmata sp.]